MTASNQPHPALLADADFYAFKSAFDSAFSHAGDMIRHFENAVEQAQFILNACGDASIATALIRAAGSSDGKGFSTEIGAILKQLLTPYAACPLAIAPMADRLGLDPEEGRRAARLMQREALLQLPERLQAVMGAHFEQAELTLSSPSADQPVSRRRAAL